MRVRKWLWVALLVGVVWSRLNTHYFSIIQDFNYRVTANFEENGKPMIASGVVRATLRRVIFHPLPDMPSVSWDHQGEAIPVRFSNGAIAFVAVKVATVNPKFGFNGAYPYDAFPLQILLQSGENSTFARHTLPPEYTPTIISFGDLNDPTSGEAVAREDIERIAGQGTKFISMTVEITDDPVDWGIKKTLPWVTSSYNSWTVLRERPSFVTGLGRNIREFLYVND